MYKYILFFFSLLALSLRPVALTNYDVTHPTITATSYYPHAMASHMVRGECFVMYLVFILTFDTIRSR